ncbi:MAG: pitrilysin family protein [Acidobacteriota bacterium]|jgi:predicted Zn-dependent peptidase
MKRVAILVLLALTPALWAQKVEVREETLSNGMRLLIVERHDSPTIACGWVARVGSVNEHPGITGISHLFEHMMFKGTKTIGTTDFAKGQEIRDQQDAVFAQMREEYSKLRQQLLRGEISGSIYDPENQTPRLKELRAQLEKLFAEEKKYIVKDELDRIYTSEGGAGLNAFTTEDQTGYFITVPSNKLELWFWLESDRLLNPVFREFYSERDVVREERRMRVESTPTGRLDELFNAMFWESAPYSWPVIGWASDVEAITREQAENYFSIYYAPNNITAILVGDVNPDQAVQLAEQYFGRIPRGKVPPPEMITFEVNQTAEKRTVGEADTNPTVTIRYHTPPFDHKDTFPLEILAQALNGRTGRLYKSLVEEKQLAVGQPRAQLGTNKYAGYLELSAEVKDGRTHQEVEDAFLAELERLKTEPVQDHELQKLKNNELADSFRRLQSNFYLLIQLVFYDSDGDWHYINDSSPKLLAVTAADIQRVADQYLTAENRSVAWYERKKGTQADEDPELAALPAQMKPMIKQQVAAIQKETDRTKLEQALARTQQMADQVPPQAKPAVRYIIKKIQERIDQLSASEGGN